VGQGQLEQIGIRELKLEVPLEFLERADFLL